MERSPEEALAAAHSALAQAAYLLNVCLVKRRLSRSWLETAAAQIKLGSAIADKLLEYIAREK